MEGFKNTTLLLARVELTLCIHPKIRNPFSDHKSRQQVALKSSTSQKPPSSMRILFLVATAIGKCHVSSCDITVYVTPCIQISMRRGLITHFQTLVLFCLLFLVLSPSEVANRLLPSFLQDNDKLLHFLGFLVLSGCIYGTLEAGVRVVAATSVSSRLVRLIVTKHCRWPKARGSPSSS